MNLSTARFAFRSKEVGIKKVVGSTRSQLVRQFLSESVLIAVTAMVVSLTLVELVLPAFNRFSGKELAIGYLEHWYAIPLLVLLTLVVGMLSGLYPALYLSSFRPAEILKSKFNRSPGNLTLRSILVVVQFTITIILIISTFIVSAQLNYSRNKDLGFNRENVLIVKNTGDMGEQAESYREQVMKIPGVMDASRSWTFPGDKFYASTYQLLGDSLNKMYNLEIVQGDYNFASTLGLEMKAGRNFSREYANDGSAILINESAVKFLGLKQPVGQFLTEPNREGGRDMHEIIGVFRDVHYKSLHEKIEPMIIGVTLDNSNPYTIIRLKGENLRETVNLVEKTWNEFMPGQVFEYFFMDENFDHLYRSEIKARTVFIIFSFLAVFVACLGLLGLSTFNAEKRIKEVGIRKVHGATVPMILRLLSKEILILVSLSSLFAWPIVYFIMHHWLQKFAYQTRIHLYYFLLSTMISLFIAIAVVVYQSMRVAKLNPVNALKCE
jgi:putative ABC transport system permease protein